jgi:D-psicose/D-tagatose/L-ribulose 3-epimerase
MVAYPSPIESQIGKNMSFSAILHLFFISGYIFLIFNGSGTHTRPRIGDCASLAEIDAVKQAGFDYIELRTSEVAMLSDSDFAKLQERLKQINLPVPVTYLFIPADIKITGPEVNNTRLREYVRKALDRVSKLGAITVVLGSGPARRYPEGVSRDDAFQQFVDFCRWLGPEAQKRGITIAVEPLRKEESNLINNLAEGLNLMRAVHDPNIQLNVDYYQLAMEKEDPRIIIQAKNYVRHVHTANPKGRVFPLKWDEYNYGPFYTALRKIGYDKEISIEAQTKDFQHEAPKAIAFFPGISMKNSCGRHPAQRSAFRAPIGTTRTFALARSNAFFAV